MGYVGYKLGLASELVKLIALVGAFFVGFQFYQALGEWVSRRTFLRAEWAEAMAMILLLAVVYLMLVIGLRLLGRFIQVNFAARLNTLGGLAVGLIRAGLIASVVLVILRQLPSPYLNASIEERSLSGRTISRMAPAVYDAAGPLIGRFWAGLRPPSS